MAVIPNHFGTRAQFHGRLFLHGPGLGRGEWFHDDSSALHLLYALFLLLSHFHKAETPVLWPPPAKS